MTETELKESISALATEHIKYNVPKKVLSAVRDCEGQAYLVGGSLRHMAMTGECPGGDKDFDICIVGSDKVASSFIDHMMHQDIGATYNSNYSDAGASIKIKNSPDIDIWCLEDTWGFNDGSHQYRGTLGIEQWFKTTRFNMDNVAFDIDSGDVIFSKGFYQGYLRKVLERVPNPNDARDFAHIAKAFKIMNAYKMYPGPKLSAWASELLGQE